MMKFIVPEAVIAGPAFQATTRDEAVREMVASLQRVGVITDADQADIVQAILRREKLGTTGIGHHIAIPHSRHQSVQQLSGTLAVSQPGLNWDSVDGEPVHVMVLLISPPDRPGEHLRALENVVTRLRDPAFVTAIRQALTAEEIWKIISTGELGGSP
jgi:nitrogen PTS system EIIA component